MEEVVKFDEIADCKILIVDDVAVLRTLIKTCLQKAGYMNLHTAESGDDALAMLEELNPDLIILDIVMPGTDGFEVCRQIRNNPTYAHMPILIQTGMEATQERAEVFEVGANDLISKPINVYELVARVKLQLQNLILQRKEKAYQTRMEAELNSARVIQESLLPNADLIAQVEEQSGLMIQNHWKASSELGGDLWGLQQIDDNRVGFFIIDFSGHGVVSALNTFRLHTLINESNLDWGNPKECLHAVNAHLAKVLSPEQFATLFWAVIDQSENTLTYSSAAAPPVLIGINNDVDGIRFLDTAGLPVGIITTYDYENHVVDFPENSFIYVYSDALIESPDADGAMWEEVGLMERAKKYAKDGFENIQPATLAEFLETAVRPIPDDLTTVSFVRK
ncbi:fused response regulator/phosphatase [Terasakiella sp. A23]|uniref:fused response regulator/phosphatase n=1 Tax=Terasakiella sp. FCG-A23 TaxID=3080561 RepID=UPI0029532E43|nr:fused response regulator/phosphatase [Terasakiella sp. A23]MDV7338698.1 fused response regulator/phosphatase [Terasakiella sp. A23]